MIPPSANINWMPTIQKAKGGAQVWVWGPLITPHSFLSCLEDIVGGLPSNHTIPRFPTPPSHAHFLPADRICHATWRLKMPGTCFPSLPWHQPWPLWPEGKSAETGVRNRGNRAKEHGSSLWLKGFWEKLPPFNFLRYNCLKKMLRD